MFRILRPVLCVLALALLMPAAALAQVGSIAGTVRDTQGGVLPGVTVEASSPKLIEKVRSTVTDGGGRYQIAGLPVGTYKVAFKLEKFSTFERSNIEITSDFAANVNAELKLGAASEVVTVTGTSAPLVDVQNARQRQVFTGEEIRDLPTTRDLPGIVNLVPGIALGAAGGGFDFNSVPNICSGGAGTFTPGVVPFAATGGQSGCSPILTGFNAHSSMNQAADLDRGRIQVDGMGIQSSFGGGRTSYIADVQNAAEVTFTLSGALGESETGGTTINIVPRTGGNRYAGNYFWSYASNKFYDRNEGTRTRSVGLSFNQTNQLDHDFDNNGSFGGPIIKNRLWFQTSAQIRGRETTPRLIYYNANEGVFGARYEPDLNRPLTSDETYRHINTRLTLQATQKNKFNLFWDEQFTCEYPCHGTQNSATSPEAQATQLTYPLHVAQVSWTNPLTNKFLLDAGGSWYSSHVNETRNRFLPSYNSIPRVTESGTTTYRGMGTTTGSINNGTYFNNDNLQMRASASYVTGNHNAKVGYDGKVMKSYQRPQFNDLQMNYAYATPASTCTAGLTPPATGTWCGLLSPGVPNPATSPFSLTQVGAGGVVSQTCINGEGNVVCRWPVPTSITEFLPNKLDQTVYANSLYIQDQWTLTRLTINGALRYDNAISRFGETCVGPDLYLTDRQYCVNTPGSGAGKDGKGVSFQNLTPRWGVAWDVFGTGKTSIKWNMGKYAAGAGITGIYTAANVAQPGRTVTSFTRGWSDINGDRIADCDLTVPAVAPASTVTTIPASGECAAITALTNSSIANYRRFGRSPDELDEANEAIGLATIQCGRNDSSRIAQSVLDYCADYFAHGGADMLHGWNKRQYEWQFGLGVQHELLPRMSVEVTYNRRDSYLTTLSDGVGIGCDLYNSAQDPDECMAKFLNWNNPSYDFFSVRAPVDENLPNGGGFLIPGYLDRKPSTAAATAASVTGQTLDIDHRVKAHWQGVDINVTLRAKGGIRLTGGTSTGAQYNNTCAALVDTVGQTSVIVRPDGEVNCNPRRPYQTNVRGTASYTIPWIDVLFSSTFSYRPGVQQSANYQYNVADLQWMEGSEYRAGNTQGCSTTVAGVTTTVPGCLLSAPTSQTFTTNLLSNNEYGEGIRLFDFKLAKNIRFKGKRVNFGMDIYNAFNSDAALQYCTTYPSCTITGQGAVSWPNVVGLTTPRYARFQMQVDF